MMTEQRTKSKEQGQMAKNIFLIILFLLLMPSVLFAEVITPYSFNKRKTPYGGVVIGVDAPLPTVLTPKPIGFGTASYRYSGIPAIGGNRIYSVGATGPSYVAAQSGDLNPFGNNNFGRQMGPPKTDGDVTNPIVTPLGGSLWALLVLVLGYVAVAILPRRGKRQGGD